MSKPNIYTGNWPGNVSKTAKYTVKRDDSDWRVMVAYEVGIETIYPAVETANSDIPEKVNEIKQRLGDSKAGTFYINEFKHLIVPIENGKDILYYFVDVIEKPDFGFEYDGRIITSEPVDRLGVSLAPGDSWIGPRPGIPYVLTAGGTDVYFERFVITAEDPGMLDKPKRRKKFRLSNEHTDREAMRNNISKIVKIKGDRGGRFYVNEHLAIFTPKGTDDGLRFVYCGQLDLDGWYSEPSTY